MTEQDIVHYRLYNQHITNTLKEPEDVVKGLGALQAQDFLGSLWAFGVRIPKTTENDIEQAIANKKIVRTWPMRGTLHFVAATNIKWMLKLLTPRVVSGSKGRLKGLEIDDAVLTRSKKLIISTLQDGKQLTRQGLFQMLEAAKVSTAGQRGIHILSQLAMDGTICFGPRNDKQHTFTLLDEWVPDAKTLSRDEALAELTTRYFTGHGPATIEDFMWWAGLTKTDAKTGLEMVKNKLTQTVIGDQTYWFPANMPKLPDISNTTFLLPPFDEYLVGYTNRSAVLDSKNKNQTISSNGIFYPTVVVGGKVVSLWKRTIKKDKVIIETSPFTALSKEVKQAVTAAAKRYADFLGKTLVE
jgi:hypothetical protein